MRNYDVRNNAPPLAISNSFMILASLINGMVFAILNILTDAVAGMTDKTWRLSCILGVSPAQETSFYTVFNSFMFLAGILLTIWYRYCLPEKAGVAGRITFALKLSAIVWLPNVLIMAFFGTSFIKTFAYGIAYVIMIIICTFLYGLGKRSNRSELFQIQ